MKTYDVTGIGPVTIFWVALAAIIVAALTFVVGVFWVIGAAAWPIGAKLIAWSVMTGAVSLVVIYIIMTEKKTTNDE